MGSAMPGADQGERRVRGVVVWVVILLTIAACIAGAWFAVSRRTTDTLERANDQGRWDDAARLARDSLKIRGDDPAALRVLARAQAHLGRDGAALAIYERRLDPTQLQADDHLLIGQILESRGQHEKAASAWEKVLQAGETPPRVLDELARIHMQASRAEEAAPVAERLSQQPGWQAKGSIMLGGIRAALNDVPGAAESFRRALDVDPAEIDRSGDPTRVRKLIARTFLRMNRFAEARGPLQSILAGGQDPEAAWLSSRASLQQGDFAAAQAALAEARSYRADHPLEAEPSPYVGEARCEKCHINVFRDSLASRHTQSYYRGAQLKDLPCPKGPLPDPDLSTVTHAFRLSDGTLRQETRVGKEVFDSVIEYAFGTSDRYLTMVNRDARGDFRVARLSYYETPDGRGWDRSALDKFHPSPSRPDEFQGAVIGVREGVAKCLYCHTTNVRIGREQTGPETADRAIGCERCHGPGGNHIAAVAAGFSDLAIVSPASASAEAVTTKQCNDCHILGTNFRPELYDAGWVRSQGIGWSMSRCNTESGGAFGCVTCHDPHKRAGATSTAQYEGKCVNCHAARTPAATAAEQGPTQRRATERPSKPCPVSPSKGCISCHMPSVRVATLHLSLTDHYIRIPAAKR
jgi:tetratricopeptide (TPR) repeat protein